MEIAACVEFSESHKLSACFIKFAFASCQSPFTTSWRRICIWSLSPTRQLQQLEPSHYAQLNSNVIDILKGLPDSGGSTANKQHSKRYLLSPRFVFAFLTSIELAFSWSASASLLLLFRQKVAPSHDHASADICMAPVWWLLSPPMSDAHNAHVGQASTFLGRHCTGPASFP